MKRRLLAILLGFTLVLSDVSPALAAGTDYDNTSESSYTESEQSMDDSEADVSSNDEKEDDTDDSEDEDIEDKKTGDKDVSGNDDDLPGDVSGNDEELPDDFYTVYPVGDSREIDEYFQSATDYPSDYVPNLRGSYPVKYITTDLPDLRNQDPYGACWSFAAMSLAEINLMKKGIYSPVDLSELHLDYFSYNPVQDPLGGLDGDSNAVGEPGETFMSLGGNVSLAGLVLASWTGAADESRYPYTSASTVLKNGIDPSKSTDDKAHLVGFYKETINSSQAQIDSVKRMIQTYGSVSLSFYAYNSLSSATSADIYNSSKNAYYNPNNPGSTNHAVSIVGWDDNFSKSNFATQPSRDGAWLIRNSWTTGSFDSNQSYSGYFWMSYCEGSIQDGTVCAYEFTTADNYDNNYQYDGSMADASTAVGNKGDFGKYANIFTAHSANGAEGECVKSASFYTPLSNATYSVKLYTDLTNPLDPTSGTLRKTVNGTTTYAGYQNVTFGEGYIVDKNEKFSIVVNLSKEGNNPKIGVECSNNGWYVSTCSASAGQSFYFYNGEWVDYGADNNSNIRIKAFTDDVAEPVAPTSISFEDNLSESNPLTLGYGFTHTVAVEVTPSNASKKVTWSSSVPSIATVDSTGLITAGNTTGSTVITATSQADPTVKATFKVNVSYIASAITVSLENGKSSLCKGDVTQFKATPTPEDAPLNDLTWTSSDPSILSINSKTGMATALAVGTVTVTATSGSASGSRQFSVYPPYINVTAYTNDDNSVSLSWNASDGVENYTLKDSSNNTITTILSDGSSSYSYVLNTYKGTNPSGNSKYLYYLYSTESGYSYGSGFNVQIGPTYNITYDVGNGVNDSANPSSYKCGRPTFYLKDPTPPVGYTFSYWTYKKGSSTYVCDSLTSFIDADRHLIANYNPIKYYIDYDKNAEDATGTVSSRMCFYDTSLVISSCYYSRTGYTFTGWNTKADGTGTTYLAGASVINLTSVADSRITLYAQWAEKTETVTFNLNGGNVLSPTSKQVTYGKAYGELPVPEKIGYDFIGWYTAATGGTKVEATTIVINASNHTLYAHWTPASYTLSFDANGGTVGTDSKQVTFNSMYGELPVPVRPGYVFAGWYTELSGGTKVASSNTYNKAYDSTLYAHWTTGSYTVTFNADGGTVSTSTKTVTYGSAYGTLPTPTRLGYDFVRWEDSKGNEITSSTIVSIGSNHTLTAIWTLKYYNLIFDVNGGNALPEGSASKSLRWGDTYGELPVPTKPGYSFLGWYSAQTGGYEIYEQDYLTVPNNVTIYAHWTPNSYTLRFDTLGGNTISARSITYGTKYGELPTAIKTGYTFIGWYTDSVYGTKITSNSVYTIPDNSTLYARYSPNIYKVTFDASGGTVNPAYMNVTYGTQYGDLPVPVYSGYDFVGWTYSNYDSSQLISEDSTVTITQNSTLYAVWAAAHYTLIFDVNGGDELPVIDKTKTVTYNSRYGTLPVPVRDGYDFAGWFTTKTGGKEVTAFTVNKTADNTTVYAHWTPRQYTVSFDGNGGTPSTDSKTVTYTLAYGELPTATLEGYTLAGWFTDPVNGIHVTEQDIYSITDGSTLYAHWQANTYTVGFNANTGTVDPKTKTVTYNSAYGELPVPEKAGKDFIGWFTEKDGGTQVTADTVVSIASDHALYAHWGEKTGWVDIGRKRYYVESVNRTRVKGWQTIDGKTYYFDESNAQLKTGWITADGNTYYLNPEKKVFGGNTVFGDLVKDGIITVAGKKYFVDVYGVRQTGFVDTASGKMFFDENSGKQLTGWITVNGATYYFDPSNDGALATGWVDDGNKRYYMNAEGQMQTGEIVVAGKTYILGENGELKKGWVTNDAGETVYADPEDGKVKASELIEDKGDYYFLDAESKPMTDNWNTVDSSNYYFGTDGKALKGWQEIDGKKYFFDNAAKSVTGLRVIGKKLYYFDYASGDGVHAGMFANGGKTVDAGGIGDIDFNADSNGVLSTGSGHYFTIADSTYYVDRNGNAVTGWIEKDGKRFYLDSSTGEMATGVKKIGFKTYYFKPDGEDKGMLYTSGTVEINNVTYTIRSDGSLVTGWSTGGYKPKPADSQPGVHNDNQGGQGTGADGNSLNAFDGQPIASTDEASMPENPSLQAANTSQANASSQTSEALPASYVQSGNESGAVINTSYADGTDSTVTVYDASVAAEKFSLAGVQVSDGSYLSDVTITSAEGTVISESAGNRNALLFLFILIVPVAAAGIVITRKRVKLAR